MSTAHDNPDSAEIPLQDDLATRKTLGPYELKRKLGQGGMGAVYLAVDPRLKRQVALKILPREKASNPQLVKRFKAEAQNASQLTHENIVSVYGAGEADGYLYIALEFIDGIDVHDLVERRGVLPVKRSIDIIKQVCRALQHALEQGIVHRDIKPANLLVRRDGVVKLADMGLARAVDESTETGITRAGTTVGTVDYMSPEQARNSKAADVRSDMYSLGCTWYHMLTGTPPFSEGSLTNKLNAHANRTPPDARDKNPAVTEGVVAVMQRMMAKDPDDRYQTPLELIKDLEGALVNKDAVSRKILEALNDDSHHEPEDDDFAADSSTGGEGEQYPVNFPWSDSGLPVQPGPATAVDHFEPESDSKPSPRHSAGTSKATPQPPSEGATAWEGPTSKGTAPGSSPAASPASNMTPVRGSTTRAAPTKASPPTDTRSEPASTSYSNSTSNSKSAPTPDYSTSRPAAASKPAPAPHKPAAAAKTTGGVSKPAAAGGRSTSSTLPPPKRKGLEDPGDQTASALSGQTKTLLTILAIVSGLAAVVFLASLADRLGAAAAPMITPVEQALPPPPVQAGNDPAAPADAVASEDGTNPTVKDALIERNELLEGKGALGKSAAGGNSSTNGASGMIGSQGQIVPDWVDANLPGNTVPSLHVRKGSTAAAERQFGTLVEALQNIPAEGARIVLSHDGPFDLTPVEISGGLVIIEAAQGTRPQIRLIADGEHRKLPWLNATDALLALDGVDIIGDAAAVPAADPWSWVRVTHGHLYVRRSSFTLTGKRSAPTIALKLTGSLNDRAVKNAVATTGPAIANFSAKSPRFLLDQSVIRGEGLQCVQLESPGFEGVVRNSLLVAGDAPAVAIRGAEKPREGNVRQLRFVTSTVCTSQQALALSSQGTTNPIHTDLMLLGSLFAAPADAHLPVLLSLEDWPANTNRIGAAGPYKNLTWNAGASAVLGFHPLLKLNSNEAANVADGPAWKKLWKEQSPTTFSTLPWPAEMKAGILATPLKSWSPKTLESLALALPAGSQTPGCPISGLRAPDYSADATSTTTRPQRPRPPAPFTAKGAPVQVDVNKTDLGKLIASKDWEDGTVFIATGSGPRLSSPITVERHKWRIQFQQAEGPALVISPRAGARSGGDNGAFITVRGGQLDLQHGSFSFDPKDPQSLTPWYLFVDGGGFTLHNCRIVIPAAAASRNRGIIRWTGASVSEKDAGDTEFSDYGVLTDSLLVGNNTLISADMNRRAIVLVNSALIGRQHLFELHVGLNSGKAGAAFDAQNCTYLAGGTQFVIKSPTAAGSNPVPCRISHYNSIFGTLPRDANAKTAWLLMNDVGSVAATSQITWYEESCGYAPELKAYFASEPALPTAPLAAQDFATEWIKRWGTDRVQRPLQGAGGVLFEKNLGPNAVSVKAENLTLHGTAKAQTWSETGGPIGARPQSLEPPSATVKAPTPTKKAPIKKPGKVIF